MESSRFLRIRCRVCGTTTTILSDRRPPAVCVKCRAPYDPSSISFDLRSNIDPDGRSGSNAHEERPSSLV